LRVIRRFQRFVLHPHKRRVPAGFGIPVAFPHDVSLFRYVFNLLRVRLPPAPELNRGFAMFRYCPSCASVNIRFEENKKFACPDCGFTYYHNIAAATACVICTGPADAGVPGGVIPGEERIVFLVRARDPAKGKLDLPGGFVDIGEGALEGLRRECREELGWEAPQNSFCFLTSFPNVYPYKNITYNTCDMFFTVLAPGLKAEDFYPEKSEIEGVRLIKPRDVRYEDIAFDSVRRAVRIFQGKDRG
jgi:ADP-ribose pyrophosphatase YjhB (NUDIX family)/predicted RNA-binding Zn-ribbon protein involved in translation (DUF1610 family)